MPRVKPDDRIRAKRPKTRTGCITCKVRRIKCDEAKPVCNRCTSTGRKCDGYDFAVFPEHQMAIQACPTLYDFEDPWERRAFSFFIARTRVQLRGFFECELWERVLPQAAHTDSSIRHGIIALASLHEDFEQQGNVDSYQSDFALKQYNLAIRQGLDAMSNNSNSTLVTETYLAASLVFICIELIQGHYASSISLLQGALKLLYEKIQNNPSDSAWPLEIFEAFLCRCQTQVIGLIGNSPDFVSYPPHLLRDKYLSLPAEFTCIAEARDWMDFLGWSVNLAHKCASGLNGRIKLVAANASYLHHILDRWSAAFDSMLTTTGDNLAENAKYAVAILSMRRTLFSVAIDRASRSAPNFNDETATDDSHQAFEDIVSLCETLVRQSASPLHQSTPNSHLFTMDFGLVSPLYETARTCRDPIIRRQAINLLRAKPCREGMWDGLLAARVAERVMEIEETAVPYVSCAADVPAWARISHVCPTFHSGQRKVTVTYIRQSPGTATTQCQEVIDLLEGDALQANAPIWSAWTKTTYDL